MRKRIISLLLAVVMVITVFPRFSVDTYAEVSLGGSGTEEDPYRISSAAEFNTFRDEINAGEGNAEDIYYLITENIDLSAVDN